MIQHFPTTFLLSISRHQNRRTNNNAPIISDVTEVGVRHGLSQASPPSPCRRPPSLRHLRLQASAGIPDPSPPPSRLCHLFRQASGGIPQAGLPCLCHIHHQATLGIPCQLQPNL